MEKQIEWTATGFRFRSSDKGPVWGPVARASTKREAVAIVNSNCLPKTAIVRVDHGYIYQMR